MGSPATAVVAAGDDDVRVLLRGLLRLHQVRVDGEAGGAERARELVQRHRPSVLVVDTLLRDGSWAEVLREARATCPSCRFILIASSPPKELPSSGSLRPDAFLLRPFRIQAFADALGTSKFGGSVGPPT